MRDDTAVSGKTSETARHLDEIAKTERNPEANPTILPDNEVPANPVISKPDAPPGDEVDDPVKTEAKKQEDEVVTDLDLARQGDIEAVDRLIPQVRSCQHAPRDTKSISRVLDNYERMIAGSSSERARTNYELQLHEQKIRFQACPAILNSLNTAREDFERLARAGDVVARYFYAMWPPNLAMEPSPLLAQTEWELQAKDFTLQNIDSGEPLGLLALGTSYQYGIFTPRSMPMGIGLLMAASSCGLVHEPTEQFLQQLINANDEEGGIYAAYAQSQFELALTVAEQAGMSCNVIFGNP